MKKITALVFCVLTGLSAASAQNAQKSITVTEERVELAGDDLRVSFEAQVGRRAARGGDMMIYRTWITDGLNRWLLPEIVVQSARARIAEDRTLWTSAGEEVTYAPDARFVSNGETFRYSAAVPRQLWMSGAKLMSETILIGCCSSDVSEAALLAGLPDFRPAPVEVPVEPVAPPVVTPDPETTGDLLAKNNPWVMPVEEFDDNLPQLMFDDDREGALKVYFSLNSFVLDPNANGNREVMRQLMSVIDQLQTSADSRVAHIVVAGYASPEGSFQLNDRLAYNRADALKRYISTNAGIDASQVHIYNGAEDWAGLRMMVEASELPETEQVIDIIDNVPIWSAGDNNGRERAIMRLNGGATYRRLLREFFPELRTASYIKVFYENK